MRTRKTQPFQARRPRMSTCSISSRSDSAENTCSLRFDGGSPSASVHARGNRIDVPSRRRTTTCAGPTVSTLTTCPSSGWCRRVTRTSAGIGQLLYGVCDGLPVRQDAALEEGVELVLDEPGQLGAGARFGVGDEAGRVLLNQAVRRGLLGAVALVVDRGAVRRPVRLPAPCAGLVSFLLDRMPLIRRCRERGIKFLCPT